VHGEGAAKIGWGSPGDYDRCVRHLGKYIADAHGYCAKAHHDALGIWPATHAKEEHAGRAAMADTKKPYGNVTYADPKNGKYPVDTEEHARAAWSYINKAHNASMYPLNGVTLSEVKGRIRAACKKFGIEISDDSMASRSAGELARIYPLEDIHILTRAEGDGSGRVVEAYATVFDQEAEIHDHQGHYKEVIDRTAFDQVLNRISRTPGGLAAQVKVLFNHGRTIGGQEAPEFQLPLGKPLDVRPEARGLLTRTERILSKIQAGTITAQSFVGGIIRSTPELRGPGDRHRARNGVLTTVRRTVLGLREYGPVLYPAYSGAEILGVRMQLPGSLEDDPVIDDELPDSALDEEYAPGMEEGGTGSVPEDTTSVRYHQHALYVLQSKERREKAGLVW
jgi:phage head maturation protease